VRRRQFFHRRQSGPLVLSSSTPIASPSTSSPLLQQRRRLGGFAKRKQSILPAATTKLEKMPLVSYSCSASPLGILALKILAKIQDTNVEFSEAAETPSLKIVTTNPVLGTSSTSTSVSWLGCARSLSQIVPSLGLWDDPTVESWVESATTLVVPAMEAAGTRLIFGWKDDSRIKYRSNFCLFL
jgi:hypothetical protein